MSHKLAKPYTTEEYENFIVEYNHNKNLRIEETITDVFALEENEILQEGMPILDPEFETKKQETQRQNRIKTIKQKLEELDLKSIRALREGGEDKNGIPYLEIYQNEINTLRQELQTLS